MKVAAIAVGWAGLLCALLAVRPVCAAAAKPPAGKTPPAAKPPAPVVPTPVTPIPPFEELDLKAEWQAQFNGLLNQINARANQPPAEQALRREATILEQDRDPTDVVLRRTEALLKDVKRLGAKRDLSQEGKTLCQIRAEAEKVVPKTEWRVRKDRQGETKYSVLVNPQERYSFFERVCQVRRQIALANPLLDFDQILFLKRYRRCPGHICDQFFGPFVGGGLGGGVFVLSDPFGANPVLKNILADSTVAGGRLKGTKLESGSFLGPDLSYDGKTVVFAYTECDAGAERWANANNSKLGVWNEKGAYHLFKANVDGTGLEQLTDGNFNDFDPCWLPNGRLAFISERRGGFGRCHGRPVPTYTLHSLNADGSDIVALSYHETNEWQPSVNQDGMLVYTRWDYVDRGDCIAHHPWITTPDGRDARPLQGNYPASRTARPDAELDLRAIPNSRRYIATAGPHHGQSFGSFVIVDPDVHDDGAMAPLLRVTPDNGFPETQGGRGTYGTAWPLSEDYYLCAFGGYHKDALYLLDSFGNHILLYMDPNIECLSPLPLRARPRPPVLPALTAVGQPGTAGPAKGAGTAEATALVACINVYDGLLPWPEGARIKALRIIQLFPKATPSMNNPNIGRWSESLARGVLGTVPVEADGSAYFTAPAGKSLYFQAVDEKGLALQNMQSDTYFHPGERLTCQGCHERHDATPRAPARVPRALQRPASTIQPEVEGSYPVSFPRLVQPVLERSCVACHAKELKAPKLSAAPARPNGAWSQAYDVLSARGYGLSGKPPAREMVRTTPGEFGARASKLFQLLSAGHHDVKLTPEDLHRLTLWLDCNSNFFGAYHNPAGQLKGELVMPEVE